MTHPTPHYPGSQCRPAVEYRAEVRRLVAAGCKYAPKRSMKMRRADCACVSCKALIEMIAGRA